MLNYSEKVMEHFLKPRNEGKLKGADAVGESGSLHCSHSLRLYLKVNEDEEITDASFMAFGCASAVASCSALTQIIKGMTLDDAANVTNDHIAEYLGGLPKEKIHCLAMAPAALKQAIFAFRRRRGVRSP